jgi:outer membrane protein insertion porin family
LHTGAFDAAAAPSALAEAGQSRGAPTDQAPVQPASSRTAPEASADTAAVSRARTLRLESIEILGNKRTRASIIEAYIELRPGDPIDLEVIDGARERLIVTDFFDRVDFSTRPGSVRGQIVLVVEVEERGFPSFETGFGYDNLYGWFVTILGLRLDNTFGPESQLRLGWRFGYRISGVDLRFNHPFAPAGPFSIGVAGWAYQQDQLFYTDQLPSPGALDPNEWRSFQQKVERVGANISTSYRVTDETRITVGLSAEAVEPDTTFSDRDDDVDYGFGDLPLPLQSGVDRTNLNGLFLRFIHDTRRNVNYPLDGLFTVVTLQANTSVLGSDLDYVKGVADIRKPIRLRGRTAWVSRLQIGMTEKAAPYYDRFYIGGIYSIRGFRELSLSPTSGDEGFWIYNGEFRFPLTMSGTGQPRLTGLLFVDVGQGWQWNTATSLDDVECGVGYGVRLKLPWLGTLGLDAGIPLTPGRTGDPYRVHASLGFSF